MIRAVLDGSQFDLLKEEDNIEDLLSDYSYLQPDLAVIGYGLLKTEKEGEITVAERMTPTRVVVIATLPDFRKAKELLNKGYSAVVVSPLNAPSFIKTLETLKRETIQ